MSLHATIILLLQRVCQDAMSIRYPSKINWLNDDNILISLNEISAPSVQIVDALGEPLRDKYYEADSTIELLCVVRHIAMQVQYSVVQWLHGNRVLNYDTTRGGIRWVELFYFLFFFFFSFFEIILNRRYLL